MSIGYCDDCGSDFGHKSTCPRAASHLYAQPAAEPAPCPVCADRSWMTRGQIANLIEAAVAAQPAAEPVCRWPECGCRSDLGEDWMACKTTAQPAAEPDERKRFEALVDDLLVASANDETESARQKAHDWFEGLHRSHPAAEPARLAKVHAVFKGVRVEGDTVVISVKGGNDVARWVCGELVKGIE